MSGGYRQGLSDSKFPQISTILFSILATPTPSNDVVLTVSTLPRILNIQNIDSIVLAVSTEPWLQAWF